MGRLYGGVETGGSWCACALGDGPDGIVAEFTFETVAPDQTVAQIAAFFAAHPRPRAVGIGAFGPLDLDPDSPTWGHLTTTPKPGWSHAALAPALAERLGVPVAIDTDVNAAALAEHRWGAGRGTGSLCYLTVGTGIGAGIVVDGRPLHGLIHPEAGHMLIGHDRHADPFAGCCPVHGDCWEGLASGPAIAQRWGSPAQQLPDEHAAWALEADYLARGILNIVLVASPQRIVAGGGVLARAPLLAAVRARLRELAGGYLRTPLLGEQVDSYLVAPALGERAGALGAIALAQDAVG
ncbi:MAG: ROK family protein [Solirubrobacteraceae bacterium]